MKTNEQAKGWEKELHERFVEPIHSKMRAMNLNGEPNVMATEKQMLDFISQVESSTRQKAIEECMGVLEGKKKMKNVRDRTITGKGSSRFIMTGVHQEEKKCGHNQALSDAIGEMGKLK